MIKKFFELADKYGAEITILLAVTAFVSFIVMAFASMSGAMLVMSIAGWLFLLSFGGLILSVVLVAVLSIIDKVAGG